jgi:uroporphyrinogen III methyltransferase/synthase
MSDHGFVYLVGAGPGSPGLLTLRALELIQSAEVIAHDLLVPPVILALASPEAEILAVGRLSGSPKRPDRLHPVVLERAQAGRRVVRLKAGDPFIFGRGAEEAEDLARAGIPYEVVPGVSAALAAAAGAAIPLTDRRMSSGVLIATGHQIESRDPFETATVVLYMVSKKLQENIDRLLQAGRGLHTPAAYVSSASRPGQRVVVGTLADLAEKVEAEAPAGPALLIVGDVVRLRDSIDWATRQPLAGRRLLVGRARPGRSRIAERLREYGAEVVEVPDVKVVPPTTFESLDGALQDFESFDALLFGCRAGVEATLSRIAALDLDIRRLPFRPIYAVGSQATEALRGVGITPMIRFSGHCDEALEEHADRLRDQRLLMVTAEGGRPNLARSLEAIGSQVERVAAYRYTHLFPEHPLGHLHGMVMPSSTAASLVLSEYPPEDTPVLVMGPLTAETTRSMGATRVIQAESDTIDSVVECTLAQWSPVPFCTGAE